MGNWQLGRPQQILIFAGIFSVALKVFFASLAHNFDVESYELVASIVERGGSVYAETHRYNYGPVWFYTLALLKKVHDALGLGGPESFHMVVAGFLGLVDLLIAVLLSVTYSTWAAIIFILCPISWLISGVHSQFDNFAVLAALAASFFLIRYDSRQKNVDFIWGTVFLGLSLCIKHIFIFLPLWWLWRKGWSLSSRMVLAIVPTLIFLLGFLPWAGNPAALSGIKQNVFLYNSAGDNSLFSTLAYMIIPRTYVDQLFGAVPIFGGVKFLWISAMAFCGWAAQNCKVSEIVPLYLMSIVALTTAMADQYLAIPVVACAVFYRHWFSWAYMVTTSVFLTFSPCNLGLIPAVRHYGDVRRLTGFGYLNLQVWLLVGLLCLIFGMWSINMRERSFRLSSHDS